MSGTYPVPELTVASFRISSLTNGVEDVRVSPTIPLAWAILGLEVNLPVGLSAGANGGTAYLRWGWSPQAITTYTQAPQGLMTRNLSADNLGGPFNRVAFNVKGANFSPLLHICPFVGMKMWVSVDNLNIGTPMCIVNAWLALGEQSIEWAIARGGNWSPQLAFGPGRMPVPTEPI